MEKDWTSLRLLLLLKVPLLGNTFSQAILSLSEPSRDRRTMPHNIKQTAGNYKIKTN
jgi:hypothetical protein